MGEVATKSMDNRYQIPLLCSLLFLGTGVACVVGVREHAGSEFFLLALLYLPQPDAVKSGYRKAARMAVPTALSFMLIFRTLCATLRRPRALLHLLISLGWF